MSLAPQGGRLPLTSQTVHVPHPPTVSISARMPQQPHPPVLIQHALQRGCKRRHHMAYATRNATAESAAWELLTKATELDKKGQLMGSELVTTAAARSQLRHAVEVASSQPWPPAAWVPARDRPVAGPPTGPLRDPQNTQPTEGDIDEGLDSNWENVQPNNIPAVILSVLASDVRLATRALGDYCRGLGLPPPQPTCRDGRPASSLQGSVYVKYNVAKQQCYASSYQGRDRGVLLQLGTQQIGHLPLGLFDDTVSPPL